MNNIDKEVLSKLMIRQRQHERAAGFTVNDDGSVTYASPDAPKIIIDKQELYIGVAATLGEEVTKKYLYMSAYTIASYLGSNDCRVFSMGVDSKMVVIATDKPGEVTITIANQMLTLKEYDSIHSLLAAIEVHELHTLVDYGVSAVIALSALSGIVHLKQNNLK